MSLKLGRLFFENSLGKFYFDEETWEVTILVEHDGINIHEHRCEARTTIRKLAEAIAKISDII